MTYGEVGGAAGYVVYLVEVVHAVFVGDVCLASQDVDDAGVDFLQLRFVGHRHASHCLSAIAGLEESAIAYHQGLDARVGAVVECLQTAARHACHADVFHVDFADST